ncbi:acyl-CoA dehydratase activase [Herbivorax sp. ANBcel31]|uniref:acyl-CoA dehydratase activase n=1 Tax=Herbivorax sp. ANBcel31 TaxID=3069754 RepID=UPI0027AEC4AD|nr:acyl-CoA dehydratase activase [Herbivorax sp. ANBcel31]MDQ2085481.1 acyl-CoA dehydratase activase [Herbivorax sp. ANBcel31]
MEINSFYLGIDVGSVSTNLVVVNESDEVVENLYLRTGGQPINALRKGMESLKEKFGKDIIIKGVGTTGSGRQLANVITGADIVKNEITTHAVAAQKLVPGVKTILEIGGQDSKIILLRNGIVCDFAMNTVCAAGTGSFLDRQAARLEISIGEFGSLALKSKSSVRIAGRCAVFAESDMIHKQQTGHSVEDIVNGLCEALVRNYLNNLAKGKEIEAPVVFQGGVAANIGIVSAFEKAIGKKIIIPSYYDVMGAYGAALIAKDKMKSATKNTNFYGFEMIKNEYKAKSIECNDCSNLCEIIEISSNGEVLARWGDRCGKWSNIKKQSEDAG